MPGAFGSSNPPIPPWNTHPGYQPHRPSGYEVPLFANGCYYPNWRIYKNEPPSSLSMGFVSHIFYAFAWVKPDGTVYLSDQWADSDMPVDSTNGCIRAFTQLKQQYTELKVILSVGGGGQASQPFAAVAGNQITAERFAASARQLVDEYGLDGIDVDWEHPSNSTQGQNYVYLLSRLRHYLPSPHYTLTSALPAGEWALQHIPLTHAQRYLDFINLMAYDFAGPWTSHSGHHAQLYPPLTPHSDTALISAHTATSYLLSQNVSSKKILLGIPVYGRSFVGANGVGDPYSGCGGDDGTFDYKELVSTGTELYTDETSGAAWCMHRDGGFVSCDNVRTVSLKGEYARQNRLGGLFYWHFPADSRGPSSLVRAGYNSLHDF